MTASPEPEGRRVTIAGHERVALDAGWEARADGAWLPARVPGTAAGALRDAGLWTPGEPCDFDAEDWWFRTRFTAPPAGPGEEVVLRLDGIATVAEVHLNGEPILHSASMFARHAVDVGARLRGDNELSIRCCALAPLLRERRRPRARWRSALVADNNLRFFRTMLLGRAPGFAPGPAAVGPWRPVALERRRRLAVDALAVRPRLDGDDGVLAVEARLRPLGDSSRPSEAIVELFGPSGEHRAALAVSDHGRIATGELRVPAVARWWPHTHGAPALHAVRLVVRLGDGDPIVAEAGRVGFRALAAARDVDEDGLALAVNGVRMFARGAVWTPADPVGLAPRLEDLRATLVRLRDAGMNIVRLPGTGAYESEAFHDLCDELGLLVWQDLMFANLDYPIADPAFRGLVEDELRDVLGRLAGRASLAVLCGNSEVEQQAAMLGLPPESGRGELFGELAPAFAETAGIDAPYVPSAPSGGDLPFRADRGVANYYGVGGYRRPLEDARRADVRFAAECLAFANVPDEAAVDAIVPGRPADAVVHHPRWKAGVPRDAGTGWDFDDVRDHYLRLVFGVDPGELRRFDHDRYLELSRAVTGEVMAEVLGEWRRAPSPCAGGIVLWWRDLAPGAGWGLLDHRGEPKVAYHHVRRALAPVAVWTSDDGLGGVTVHVANDRAEPLRGHLRVALYRDLEQRAEAAEETLEVPAHGACERGVEALIGRFVDAAWAYRFGPPAHDAIVAALEVDGSPVAQAVRFPAGRPLLRERPDRLGLRARIERDGDALRLHLSSERLAYGVRVLVPDHVPDDDALCLEPGVERIVALRPGEPGAALTGGAVTALNMDGRVRIQAPGEAA